MSRARALAGKRVLVPVTAQRRDLALRLTDLGMRVDEVEFIAIAPPEDSSALDAATMRWCEGHYDWLAVTSRNAVLAMAQVARERGVRLDAALPHAKVASVGEATVGVCEQVGLTVSLVPAAQHNAAGIVADFPEGPGTVLAPLGNLASPVLPRGLARKGWEVDAVEAYRTIDGPGVRVEVVDALARDKIDAVILTSGSVAERLAAQCPSLGSETMVVAIGATTAASARAAGLAVDAVAARPSYDGILDSLLAALAPEHEAQEAP